MKAFFRILYQGLIHLGVLLFLPVMFYQMLKTGKYKANFKQRLGIGLPEINKGARKLIWVHAVSLGETKGVAPLVKMLMDQHEEENQKPLLVFSNASETGHKEACRLFPQAIHLYLPLDLPYIVKPYVRRVKPDLLVLMESDFWPNFMSAVKESGGKIALVNGKLSEKTFNRWKKFSGLRHLFFDSIDLFCIQSEGYAERFKELGFHHLHVTGNIKLDDEYPIMGEKEKDAFRDRLGIEADDEVIVIGSTHAPEEDVLLKSLSSLLKLNKKLKVVIVPRHLERFDKVAEIMGKYGPIYRAGSLKGEKGCQLILVDAMGLLRAVYQVATIAIVAGSYVESVGGHNLLEPNYFGVPVLYGPHVWSQPELHKLIQQYGSGKQVEADDLLNTVETLLKSSDLRKEMGERGKKIFQEARGASLRSLELIQTLFKS